MSNKRLKELRIQKGFTQEELAEKAGLSVGMISQLEKGTKKILSDSFRSVLKALDITTEEYFLNGFDKERRIVHDVRKIINGDKFYLRAYLFVVLRTLILLNEADIEHPAAHDTLKVITGHIQQDIRALRQEKNRKKIEKKSYGKKEIIPIN